MSFHRNLFVFIAAVFAAFPAQAAPSAPPLTFYASPAASGSEYVTRRGAYSVGLRPSGFVLAVRPGQPGESLDARLGRLMAETPPKAITGDGAVPVSMTLLGADPAAPAEGLEPGTTLLHFLRGANLKAHTKNLHRYRRVRYRGVYRGVDIEYYGDANGLEYDFVVGPDADPEQIRLRFDRFGANESDAEVALSINADGDLVLHAGKEDWELVQRRPVTYQLDDDGHRSPVEARYVLDGQQVVGFAFGAYDPGRPLVIDPLIQWSRVLTGSRDDSFFGTAIDENGFVYSVGRVESPDIPIVGALQPQKGAVNDAYIAKFGPDGQDILFATFLGGNNFDVANGIALDRFGFIYVAGSTSSPDFPTTDGVLQPAPSGGRDIFVAKLTPDGSELIYSTRVGGADRETAAGIRVDDDGNAYVAGSAFGPNFPTTPGAFQPNFAGGSSDGYIFKLNADATELLYSTYYGGSGRESVAGIVIDAAGRAFISGSTMSADLNVTQDAYQSQAGGGNDAFVAGLDEAGEAVYYASYLGGSGSDSGSSLDLDPFGYVWLAGTTASRNFPTTPENSNVLGGERDGFLARLPLPAAIPLPLPSAEGLPAGAVAQTGSDDAKPMVRVSQEPGSDFNSTVSVAGPGSGPGGVLVGGSAGVGEHDQITGGPLTPARNVPLSMPEGLLDTLRRQENVDLNIEDSAVNGSGEGSVAGRATSDTGSGQVAQAFVDLIEGLVGPDMEVTKALTQLDDQQRKTAFLVGFTIFVVIEVTNKSSTIEITDVLVVDQFPAGFEGLGVLGTARGGDVDGPLFLPSGLCDTAPSTLFCRFESIPPGESIIVFGKGFHSNAGKKFTNTVTATAANVSGWRIDSVSYKVEAPVKVGIEKDSRVEGGQAVSVITVTNKGETTATNVRVTDDMKVLAKRATAKSDKGTCKTSSKLGPKLLALVGGPVSATCSFDSLAAGETVSITVKADPSNPNGKFAPKASNTARVDVAQVNTERKTSVTKYFDTSLNVPPDAEALTKRRLLGDDKKLEVRQAAVCTGVEADVRLHGLPTGGNVDFVLDNMGRTMPDVASMPEGCSAEDKAIRCSLGSLEETRQRKLDFELCTPHSPPIFTLRGRVTLDGEDADPGNDVSELTIRVDPDALPSPVVIGANGIVGSADFRDTGLAPGSHAALFGIGLAPAVAVAESVPFPRELLGTSVEVNGIQAPLIFVSPQQINFQTPWEVAGERFAEVVVRNAFVSEPERVYVVRSAPGLFSLTQTGSGQGAVLIAGTASVAGPAGSPGDVRPAKIGEFLSIFCIGLGPVEIEPFTGEANSLTTLSRTLLSPTVTLGGVDAPVIFSGLSPGFVGVYQVNVEIPPGAPTGDAVDLRLSIDGVDSNTVTVAVTN